MKNVKNPINIALIFDQEVQTGGGFQQALNAALLASKLKPNLAKIIFFHTKKIIGIELTKHDIQSSYINLTKFQKFYLYLKTTEKYRIIYKFIKIFFDYNFFESFLLRNKIDLVYFVSPSRYAIDLNKLNFIYTIWDLCHLDQIEFPEIKEKNEFNNRELKFKLSLPKATSIIVDSICGKDNLVKKYNVDQNRVFVIPFQPLNDIDVQNYNEKELVNTKKKYRIKNKYIFYPAQFWAHKNHIYILKSLYILEKKYNIDISAVFSGGDKGNMQNIINYANKLDIRKKIIFTGFISNIELISHYKNSIALVMPTYFGPTNLPPYEAFKLGTPVIYPNLFGLKEQVEDGALLVDLNKPETLALNLKKILNDKKLRDKLIKKGYKLSRKFRKYKRLSVLHEIITNFTNKYHNFQNY